MEQRKRKVRYENNSFHLAIDSETYCRTRPKVEFLVAI